MAAPCIYYIDGKEFTKEQFLGYVKKSNTTTVKETIDSGIKAIDTKLQTLRDALKDVNSKIDIATKSDESYAKPTDKDFGKRYNAQANARQVDDVRLLADRRSNIQSEYNRLTDERARIADTYPIKATPSAPFITDTNAWTKLGLKYALKEAVKQGAYKIAWTTGEQQNDRYDLRKQVDKIEITKRPNADSYRAKTYKDGKILEDQDYIAFNQLEGMFGKEIAKKVQGGESVFEGEGLAVGGKGMKGFYGSPTEGSLGIVGNVAKSLFKQEPKTTDIRIDGYKEGTEYVDVNGDVVDAKNNAKTSTQHSIDITPELKASVEGGQPLFKDAEAQYRIESGKNIVEAIKDFNGSKKATVALTHEIMHPTVVSIIDGAKEGNEVGTKHTETIVSEFNKANPKNKVTVDELIKGNDDFKGGKTSEQYRAVQEFIAESWEKYHTEGGKGFSEAFQKVLDQITQAFKAVYKSISGKEITPELKKMFDEILGKESESVNAPIEEVKGEENKDATKFDKVISASSRFKPHETVVFDKPIIGKNGNKLISYQWAYEWTMQPSGKDTELKSKRVSDWTQAENSAETGRDIVHKFTVERKDGTIVTVSSETIPSLLGYVDAKEMKNLPSVVSSVKTLAKQRMQLAILEAQEKEYNELREKYSKAEKPKIEAVKMVKENAPFALRKAVEFGDVSRTIFSMGDVTTTQDNPYTYNRETGKADFTQNNVPSRSTIENLESSWIQERIKQDGGKYPNGIYDLRRRIERQERKVEQATGSKIKTADIAEPISKEQDKNISKKVVDEINSKQLTHVEAIGMGAKQADGMYISTEPNNRYATKENPAKSVTVDIKNPKVTDYVENAKIQQEKLKQLVDENKITIEDISEEYREEIANSVGKEIKDVTPKEVTEWHNKKQGEKINEDIFDWSARDKAAKLITEQYKAEGHDALYIPQTETQEGELIVFDRKNVKFPKNKFENLEQQQQVKEIEAEIVLAENNNDADKAKEVISEVDNLLKATPEQQARDNGEKIVDGTVVKRQPKINAIIGKAVNILFSKTDKQEGNYAVIEASDLQPSHKSGIKNELHFIPEAQPRDRGGMEVLRNEAKAKADNLDPSQLADNNIAYFGSPIVNERGEVIQGNGRAEAIDYYYNNDKKDSKGYRRMVAQKAKELGIDHEAVANMKNPVLVRLANVDDETAILLGNKQSSELEDVKQKGADVKAAMGKLTPQKVKELLDTINAKSDENSTLRSIIRDNINTILDKLFDLGALRVDNKEHYFKGDEVTPEGIQQAYDIIKQLLFDGAESNLQNKFDSLPFMQREAIEKTIPAIIGNPELKSRVQDAIKYLFEYQESQAGSFSAWANQMDIFGDQKTPSQKYSAATLALAKQMNDAKSQKAISTNIIELAQKMNGKEGDLFFPAIEGVSFEEAIGVKDNKLPEIQISEKSVQLVKDIKAALSLQGNNNKKLAIEKLYADKNSKYTENEVKAALEVNKDFEKLVQDMQDDNLLNKICKT